MDMDSDTTDMDSDTMAMDLDTTDTARGLLMLRPIPTFFTEDTTDRHGLGYYGHGLGYYGHGLGYYRYGKRSADAEADPYLLYGGHYGYGHGLGYYGHGLGYYGHGLGYYRYG